MRHLVNEVERISAVIAKLTEVRSAALMDVISEPCSHLLTSLRREYPGQLEFGVANRLGVIVCTTRGARSLRQVEGAQFRRALDSNAFVVGGYGKSQTTDAVYLTFAYPIRDDAGAAVGAVLTGMPSRRSARSKRLPRRRRSPLLWLAMRGHAAARRNARSRGSVRLTLEAAAYSEQCSTHPRMVLHQFRVSSTPVCL